jgi:hypothetical protein
MSKGFQRNAFQTPYPSPLYAFQAIDRYVEVIEDSVGVIGYLDILIRIDDVQSLTTYKAISLIMLRATIKDPSVIPYQLFDPTSVKVYLYDPTGVLVLDGEDMIKVSVGEYTYPFQSDTDSPLGRWTISVKATSGDNVFQTLRQVAFILSDL